MKLTHHSTPSRSFILLIVITLCTVYAALVLSRINRLYQQETITISPERTTTPPITRSLPLLDTSQWREYRDNEVPLIIQAPPGWRITFNKDLDDFYTVVLTRNSPRAQIKIYVSENSFAAIEGLTLQNTTAESKYQFTLYDDSILTTKVGEYYYTFDGVNASEDFDVLSTIAQTAILD